MSRQMGLFEKAYLLSNYFYRRVKSKFSRRGYEAAKINRLTSGWVTSSSSSDADIRAGLTVLRARSRDLCQNIDYGKKFMHLLESNVVGPRGIRLIPKPKKIVKGKAVIDKQAKEKIQSAWKKFCHKQNCTTSKKYSFDDVCKLAIKGIARDGEFISQLAAGFKNDFLFSLQLIEPDYLDHTFDDPGKNIKMGVQLDKWKAPAAYYFLTAHPGDGIFATVSTKYDRVAAARILHIFIADRVEQTRGVPWTHTAVERLYNVGHYEKNELVASRVSAAKMGFYYSDNDALYPADGKTGEGDLVENVEPGSFKKLPYGYQFKEFDPKHPTEQFDKFIKAVLRGAAAGLNVSYASLSNDLTDVNYSSIRHGAVEERDIWMLIQNWFIEHFVNEVYRAWVPYAIGSGQLDLPITQLENWLDVRWQAKRWAWIDPLKDTQANQKAIDMQIKSRSRIIAESGEDPEEIFEEIAEEQDLIKTDNDQTAGAENARKNRENPKVRPIRTQIK